MDDETKKLIVELLDELLPLLRASRTDVKYHQKEKDFDSLKAKEKHYTNLVDLRYRLTGESRPEHYLW